MLARLFLSKLGPADTVAVLSTPGAGVAAVCTLPVVAGKPNTLSKVVWSYNADPTNGRLTITLGGVTVLDVDITKGGPGALQFGAITGTAAIVVTLAHGGVTPKLYAEGVTQ